MVHRERRRDRGVRLAQHWLQLIGEELREGRLRAALTQEQLGAAVGISHTEVSRIERGRAPHVPYETLVVMATVLGMDLPLRAFPAGDPVRDAPQLALLGRFRGRLGPALGWRTEVPLQIPGDRRAWDAVVVGDGWQLPIDAESRLRDVQACTRRTALKQRDDQQDCVILLVADTRHNRRVLRLYAADIVAAFPVRGVDAMKALARGERPSGSAIILL